MERSGGKMPCGLLRCRESRERVVDGKRNYAGWIRVGNMSDANRICY
jgi:hypothetical protein